MKPATILAIIAFLILASGAYIRIIADDPTTSGNETVVENWLEAQRQGRLGIEFWSEQALPSSLFAVRDWEIVRSASGKVVARVDSSTESGQHMTAHWEFTISDNPPRIYSVEEM